MTLGGLLMDCCDKSARQQQVIRGSCFMDRRCVGQFDASNHTMITIIVVIVVIIVVVSIVCITAAIIRINDSAVFTILETIDY